MCTWLACQPAPPPDPTGLDEWARISFLEPCDVWRSTRRVEPANSPDKIGTGFRGRLPPRSAGLVSDLNTFGLRHLGSASPNGDLEHAVLEVGADIACV